MTQADDGIGSLDRWEVQLRKGSLGLAVLATLWGERLYGLEILRRLEAEGGLSVPEGTIYPLLTRLRKEQLVTTFWRESESGPPRRYYELTDAGWRISRRALTIHAIETRPVRRLLPRDPA